jgi:hypothetical protein
MLYTNDAYAKIGQLKQNLNNYEEALAQSREVLDLRNKLLQERNNLPADGMKRLEQLLPSSIDSVKLIVNVNDVAMRHHLQVTNIFLEGDTSTTAAASAAPDGAVGSALGNDGSPVGSVSLQFSVKADYDDFRAFLHDMERSLRLMDVREIAFSSSAEKEDQYSLTIKTYWIK